MEGFASVEFFTNLGADAWTAIFTGGLFITAVFSALYAAKQWKTSRDAQLETMRPYVLVSVEPSRAHFNLFDLVIRNIGKRPAVDVRIVLDPPPVRAREMTQPDIQIQNMKILTEPMAQLAPEQVIRAFYDNHVERKDRNDLPILHHAKVSYKDAHGNKYSGQFTLDIHALKGMSQTDVGDLHTIHRSLEKISKTLSGSELLKKNPNVEIKTVVETLQAYEEKMLQGKYEDAVASRDFIRQITPDDAEVQTQEARGSEIKRLQQQQAAKPFLQSIQRLRHLAGFIRGRSELKGRLVRYLRPSKSGD